MLDRLKLLIRSENSIIALDTRDEVQGVELVRKAADDMAVPLFEWTITAGMTRTKPTPAETGVKSGKVGQALDYVLDNKGDSEIYLFKDLGPHTKDAVVQRQLRDLCGKRGLTLVLIDADPLPEQVRRLAVPLKLPLPNEDELEKVVRDTFHQIKARSLYEVTCSLTKRDMETLVQTLRGLTAHEAARVVATAVHDDYALTAADLPRVIEAKRNLLQGSGCLEAISVNVAVDEIGGLDRLKAWLAKRRGGLSGKARSFGLDPPRGILLLGVQGCGKSLCAKVVAADWNMALLRLDPGVLYQKFVGESENQLRQALAQAESMAPVVLWIDEIEKAFASAAAESADGGLSQRMFGTLLSWMQDQRNPIFIVATANNIAALPPELMRKGRFDEVFFVDLPTAAARKQVLTIHLRRRKRDPAHYNLDKVAAATDGFSGAELEQLIVSALYAAFADGKELDDEHLLGEVKNTRPLSVLMGERVKELRAWADGRCVPAD
jgi:ATP-dependent 26S proteasome regulatory subunit